MIDIKLKLKPGHTQSRDWMALSPLRTLFWNVTYACNFRCGICFTDSGRPHPDELTTEQAKAMIDRAHAAGVRDIIISGGEPFLRRDLTRLLGHMARLDMPARIASNGSLLSDDILRRLRDETLTKSFQISLDSLDPAVYAAIHGAPSEFLDTALAALGRIRDHGFHTTVSTRLTPQTLPGIPAILDRAAAEGWSTVTVHCTLHTRRVEGARFRQDADVLALLEPVFEHFLSLPSRWLVETYLSWAPYHSTMKRLARHIRVEHLGCVAGRNRLTISPSGWISPCICLDVPAAYIGNVQTHDLLQVFTNSPTCEMMRRPQQHGICVECPQISSCGGGCRAAAFALTGRLDGQDESCPVWNEQTTQRT